jgi:uncharacterized protein YceK
LILTVKPLAPPDNHHLKAAGGWIELGNYLDANEELEFGVGNELSPQVRRYRTCMRNLIVTLSSLALLCSGCGTMAGHDDTGLSDGVNHGVYRGVRSDWQWITHASGETTLGVPVYFVDTPFSFVADTVCLPFDAITVMAKPERP